MANGLTYTYLVSESWTAAIIKNRAAIAIYKDYQQATSHGTLEPLLVIKQNHSKPLAVVDLDYFIKLMSERKQ